jgi:uncharacterized protein (TIGR02145 family)
MKQYLFLFLLGGTLIFSCGKKDKKEVSPDCSGLQISSFVNGGDVSITGTGGQEPFTFSIDNGTYSSTSTYSDQSLGSHTIAVKDANGCTATSTAEVNSFTDDRDGQSYKVVTIGTQTWMAENLNYDFPDSSWCYNNISDSCDKYGHLYNYYAAERSCPVGWHLPTDDEAKILEKELGMNDTEINKSTGLRGINEGTKLKVGGSANFNFLLGGQGNSYGFSFVGEDGYFWTTMSNSSGGHIVRGLDNSSEKIFRGAIGDQTGISVRCIKD